jgi:hypothetical protein
MPPRTKVYEGGGPDEEDGEEASGMALARAQRKQQTVKNLRAI